MKKCSVCGEVYNDDSIEMCEICGNDDFIMSSPKKKKPQTPSGNMGTQMNKPKPVKGQAHKRPAKINVQNDDDFDFDGGFSNSIESFNDGLNSSGDTSDDTLDFGGDFGDDFESDDFSGGFEDPPVQTRQRQPQQQPVQGQRPRKQRAPAAQQVANGQIQRQNPQRQRPALNKLTPSGQQPAGQTGQSGQPGQPGQTAPEAMINQQKPIRQPKQKMSSQDGSSVLDWILVLIQLIIPLWNILFIIKTITGKTVPDYKKNYMKAFLIYFVVMAVISSVVAITLGDKIVGLL